jgi:hypothetical protein
MGPGKIPSAVDFVSCPQLGFLLGDIFVATSRTNVQKERVPSQRHSLKWHGIVESLGEEFSCPLPEVERMLSDAAHQLEEGAHITDFIPVLAVKEVKGFLRAHRHISPRQEQRELNHP